MACPNINSIEWKNLVAKIGVFEAMKEFIKNNEEIPDADKYADSFKGVNATMKVITALQKIPRNSYPSNNIQGFYNDLIKQGAPNDQIELLKNYIQEHNIKEINKNDLIIGLLSEMSYTVEINTTTDVERLYQDGEEYIGSEKKPTQHYSNMIVPGGTNYTENEIATPQIIPSIKGHAQFATGNGIGWFRSDDRINETGFSGNWEDGEGITSIFNNTTRRILEVQSDLFQKGRDKNNIVSDKGFTSIDQKSKYESQNQFLQLLNKDNNWVTFFVKSIIQDSAKKGYEKVLFPTGNTASKVEGHTTLEEFKKQKEDRIKELEKDLNPITKSSEITQATYLKYFQFRDSKGESVELDGRSGTWLLQYQTGKQAFIQVNADEELVVRSYNQYIKTKKEDAQVEVNQLKQELERVETEGFGALKPIYNFYENTVTNILKKQGFNPKLITDEYGNTWNQVQLSSSHVLDTISFHKSENDNTNFKKGVMRELITKDIINPKQYPGGSGNYYIKKTFKGQDENTYAPQDRERINLQKIDEINHKYGWKVIDTVQIGNGLVVRINSQTSLFDEFNESDLVNEVSTEADREWLKDNILAQDIREEEGVLNTAETLDNIYRAGLMYNKSDMVNVGTILKNNEKLLSNTNIAILSEKDFKKSLLDSEKYTEEEIDTIGAVYEARGNRIMLSQAFLDTAPTETIVRAIMEEMLHALTVQPFYIQEAGQKLNDNEQKFVNSINKLYQSYKRNAPNDESYRFSNAREFIAGVLLDPSFQRKLARIDEQAPGFLQKFYNALIKPILEFLGIKVGKEIRPFQSLTLQYVNEYLQNVDNLADIEKLDYAPGHKLISTSRDKRLEREELKTSMTDVQKEYLKTKITTYIQQLKSISGTSRMGAGEIRNSMAHIQDEYKKFTKDDINQIDFFFDFIGEINTIFDSLIQKGKNINSNPVYDNDTKLARWSDVMSAARDYDSTIKELAELKAELLDDELITRDMGNIIVKRSDLQAKYTQAVFPIVSQTLTDIVSPGVKKALSYLDDEIEHLNKRIDIRTKEKDLKTVEKLKEKRDKIIKERDEKYNIDNEKMQNWLRGIMGDSEVITSYVEAAIVSGNPIVSGLAKFVKDKLHESNNNILNFANDLQTEIEEYAKNTGLNPNDIEAFNEPLLELYDVIESMNDDFTTVSKQKLALLGQFNMQYIQDYQFYSIKRWKLEDKIKASKDPDEIGLLELELKQNEKDRKIFIKDYMERPYIDEVHDALDLINEELEGVDSEGNYITFTAQDYVKGAYDKIQNLEDLIDETSDDAKKEELYSQLDIEKENLKSLRTTYEKDPNSNEYKVAEQLKKRDTALKPFRTFILKPSGQLKFEREKARIDRAFEDGDISERDKNYWYQTNTQIELSESYWKAKNEILEGMNDILVKLNVSKTKNEDLSKLYQDVQDIVKPHRDEEGIIKGNDFNEKQVADIKKLEEDIEKVKDTIANIFGLNRTERIELSSLNQELEDNDYLSQIETDPDRRRYLKEESIRIENRIDELTNKKKNLNRKLLTQYFDFMKRLADLDSHNVSDYYTERYALELDKHSFLVDINKMGDRFNDDGTIYEKIGKQWYAKTKKGSNKIETAEAIRVYQKWKGLQTFADSKWYKENHIERMRWVKNEQAYDPTDIFHKSGQWEEVSDPIYIWNFTRPTDPVHILKDQPSIRYKSAMIKPEFRNPHFRESINGYNIPKINGAKDDRYINQKYATLAAATDPKSVATFKYLNFVTKAYEQSQLDGYVPKIHRLGLDMPSIRASETERLKGLDAKGLIDRVGQVFRGVGDKTIKNEQDRDILYGYLDNKGTVPIPFHGDIDVKDQSRDIARMIGMYHVAMQNRQKLMQCFPLLKAVKEILTENTPVKMKNGKVQTMAKKYLGNKTVVAKHIAGRSAMLNQVDELINSLIFGEKIKEEKGSKQVNAAFGIGANLMLGLNFGSMVQNWANAKIQSILEGESKLTKNFTPKEWAKAEVIYWANIGPLMKDLGKYGNKSYINQFIDNFGGINFNITGLFNKTLAHKALTGTVGKLLMPTEMAEHQLSTVLFLSIALNTKVNQTINGKVEKISLFDAYHIENSKFSLKDGVEISKDEEMDFINRLNSSARRINGEYGHLDSPIAQKYMLGRMFMFMNKYFVPFLMRRFATRRFNIQDGLRDDGFYTLFFKTVGTDIKNFQFNIIKNWKDYTSSEKAAVKQTLTEISVSLVLIAMISLLGGDEPKDVKDNSILANNLIYILKGIRRQNEQFMPVPGLGFDDVWNRIKNPFPLVAKLGQAMSILNDVVYLAGYEMGYNEQKDVQYLKKSGWHDKGDWKIFTDIGKLLSIPNKIHQVMHPDIAIQNLAAFRMR